MISVVLPFYNSEKTLTKCLESLQNQTLNNFEIILCNDGSTDNSLNIAKQFLKDSRFKLLSQDNRGVVAAHNVALESAQGDFIARMDADDWAHPQRLQVQLEQLTKNPNISISATCVEFKSELPNAQGFAQFVQWNNSILSPNDILENRFIEMPIINPTTMIRRSVFR